MIKIFKIIAPIMLLLHFACNQEGKNVDTVYLTYPSLQYNNHLSLITGKPLEINARNILILHYDSLGNNIPFNGKNVIRLEDLKELIKSKLNTKIDSIPHPSITHKTFNHLGNVFYPNNFIINAQFHPDIRFSKYIEIRQVIFSAYNEVRDSIALKFSNKTFIDLYFSSDRNDSEIFLEINSIYPIRYTETTLPN